MSVMWSRPSTPPRSMKAPKSVMFLTMPFRVWPTCSSFIRTSRLVLRSASSSTRRLTTMLRRRLFSLMILNSKLCPSSSSMLGTRRRAIWLPGRNASTPIRSTTTPPLIFLTSVPLTPSSFSCASRIFSQTRMKSAFFFERTTAPSWSSRCSRKTSISSPSLRLLGSLNSSIATAPSDLNPTSRMTAVSVTRSTFDLTISPSWIFESVPSYSRVIFSISSDEYSSSRPERTRSCGRGGLRVGMSSSRSSTSRASTSIQCTGSVVDLRLSSPLQSQGFSLGRAETYPGNKPRASSTTRVTCCSSVRAVVSSNTASGAGLRGAIRRLESAASRAASAWLSRRTSSTSSTLPRCDNRRRARSSGVAVKKIFSGASGKTTVPMSRPSTTTPPSQSSTALRCWVFTQVRTSGMAANADTCLVTRSLRIAWSTSTPATSGRKTSPTRTRRTGSLSARPRIFWPDHPSPFSPPPSPMLSRAASVSARYSAPESRCAQPSCSATRPAVELLPDAAGPSMAMSLSTLHASRRHVGTNAIQIFKESWIAYRHRFLLRELHIPTWHRSEDGERHRQPVVGSGFDTPPRRLVTSFDVQIVSLNLGPKSHRAQIGGDQLEAIALLHTQFTHFAKDRLTCCATREHREHRHLVHQRWDLGSSDFCPFERRGPDEQIGHGLSAFIAQIDSLDVRTHAIEDHENTRPRRVHADVLDEQLASFGDHGGSHHECSRRDVTRHGNVERRNTDGGWLIADGAVPIVNVQPQMGEQSLRVIARPIRFGDRNGNLPRQSRKQDRALHLRARHGTRIRQP